MWQERGRGGGKVTESGNWFSFYTCISLYRCTPGIIPSLARILELQRRDESLPGLRPLPGLPGAGLRPLTGLPGAGLRLPDPGAAQHLLQGDGGASQGAPTQHSTPPHSTSPHPHPLPSCTPGRCTRHTPSPPWPCPHTLGWRPGVRIQLPQGNLRTRVLMRQRSQLWVVSRGGDSTSPYPAPRVTNPSIQPMISASTGRCATEGAPPGLP